MPKTNKQKRRLKAHKKPSHIVRRSRYIMAAFIATIASVLAWSPQLQRLPQQDVLAYATNTSPSGLLSATNTQRVNNGAAPLSTNSLLAQAAQAKADDMVARNYWSHQTPDGKQPWVFISSAGYTYSAVGENLAYGFMSSGDTVTGWMNSPSHRANMLSTAFSEVGFGIANSTNYVNSGEQTVVVAMYGAPQVAGASTSTAPSSSTKTNKAPATSTAAAPAPRAEPTPEPTPEPAPVVTEQPKEDADTETIAISPTSETSIYLTANPSVVSRIELLTGAKAAWSATAVVIMVALTGVMWAIHRGIRLKRYVLAGENYLLHHPDFDVLVLAVVYLGFVLLTGSGSVR